LTQSSHRANEAAACVGELCKAARAMHAPLSEAGGAILIEYLHLLERWNARFNLSSIDGIRQMVDRHLLDSLAVAPWVSGETVVDAGSGAGLPGIPLAVAFPQRDFVLIDSNGKKARFLFQAKTSLGLDNVRVEHGRVEDYDGPAQLVTCRALAPLPDCVSKTRHLLAEGATLLVMAGRAPQAEAEKLLAPFRLEFLERVEVPGASSRHVVGIGCRQRSTCGERSRQERS